MTWQKMLGRESGYFVLAVFVSFLFWFALAVIVEQGIIAQEHLYSRERNAFVLTIAFFYFLRLSAWITNETDAHEGDTWKAEDLKTVTKRLMDEAGKLRIGEAKEEEGGVPAEDVISMRRSGMGWGQIAHELGIHPGALGLGHTKNKQYGYQKSKMRGKNLGETGELEAITSRNLKTGWSKGHGTDLSSHSGGKGHSNGKRKSSDKGKGKGKGKDQSTGKGNGNKGGKNK